MTLYVTLNSDGELMIEHDYGGVRTVFIEDIGGPTQWEWDTSWEVPERAKELVDQAIEEHWTAVMPQPLFDDQRCGP